MDILRLDIPDRLSLFKLPPTSNSKGYYIGDWKEQIWEGGLKIFESNDKMIIKFFKDGKLYTSLTVPDNYEEAIVKCEDSVRGFAIRLNNPNGGFTWIGLGFRDRNTAFDFRSRIIDFFERKNDDQDQKKIDINKVEDFSMKKGEKISFSLGGQSSSTTNTTNKQQYQGNFVFDMPNSSGNNTQQPSFTSTNTNNNNSNWDSWNFGNTNNNNSNNNNSNNNSNKQNDFFADFSDFSNFGNQKQQQQPQQQQQWGFGGNQNEQQWGFGGNQNNNSQQQGGFGGNNFQQQQQQQQFQPNQQQYQQNNYNPQQNQQQNNNTNKQPTNTIDLLDL